jgi:hypothetical protein
MKRLLALGIIALAGFAAGCDQGSPAMQAQNDNPTVSTADSTPAAANESQPPGDSASSETPPSPAGGDSAAAPSDPKVKAAEDKLKAKPDDPKLKAAAAEANYQVGHAMMLDPELGPRVKYRGALKLFRRALELDPKHAKAAAEKKQIEDIYESMGRPVPS